MFTRENKVILIDVSFLFDQYSRRGIGRYGKEVIKRLIKVVSDEESPKWEVHLIGFLDLEKNLIELGLSQYSIEEIISKIYFHSLGQPNLSSFKNIRRWKKHYAPVIDDIDPDIYFAPHFERGLPTIKRLNNSISNRIKTVVTAHDTIPLINNKFSQKGKLQNLIKKYFYKFMWNGVQNAHLVFAPSEHSRQDLIKYGNIEENRIVRTYLGIDSMFFKSEKDLEELNVNETLSNYGILVEDKKKDYFFYDSGLEANKGIDNLLAIFSNIVKKDNDKLPKYLVITGGDLLKGVGKDIKPRTKNGEWLLNEAERLGVIAHIIATDKISDEDLLVLLFNAKAYIYMSNYEGFGFGPIQAMAAEIPAIVSNSSCLPEITQEKCLLVTPSNHQESTDAIVKYLEDEKMVKKMVKDGLEVAKTYDWDKTVEETWSNMKSIAK